MLFDRPASLPVATVHSSSQLVSLRSQLRGARDRGLRWVRPRLVPLLVAVVGMLAVLGAAEYLTHLARYTPTQPALAIEAPVRAAAGSLDRFVTSPVADPVRVVVLSAP